MWIHFCYEEKKHLNPTAIPQRLLALHLLHDGGPYSKKKQKSLVDLTFQLVKPGRHTDSYIVLNV